MQINLCTHPHNPSPTCPLSFPLLSLSLPLPVSRRHAALEESLTDKQQLLTRMADCLSWLQQAEKHMARQKPLGEDYYQIHTQFITHQVSGVYTSISTLSWYIARNANV